MTNQAAFNLLTEINDQRAALGFAPFSKYEFATHKELRTEYRRVMADMEVGRCFW